MFFDATNVPPDEGFTPVPAGDYTVAICESERGPNKAGTGENLKLSLQILDGEHKGRKVNTWLCIRHQKPDTQRMALGALSAICRAVGVMKPNAPSELHTRPMLVAITVSKGSDGDPTNNVKRFRPASGAAPAVASTATDDAPPSDPREFGGPLRSDETPFDPNAPL